MKKELRKIPGVGFGSRKVGHIFLDRSNRHAAVESLNEAKRKLVSGTSVVIFPEGTRSITGKMGTFKRGAFKLALDLELPILPLTLIGTEAILPNGTARLRPGKAKMIIHEPIQTSEYSEDTIQELMAHSKAIIEKAFLQYLMVPVKFSNFIYHLRFSLLIKLLNEVIVKIIGAFFQLHGVDSVKKHSTCSCDVFSIDMIRIGLPVHPSEFHFFAWSSFFFLSNDILVKLNEAEHIHETCTPGVIASESDIAIKPPYSFFVFEDSVPERLQTWRIKTIDIEIWHPGYHLRLPRIRLFAELFYHCVNLVNRKESVFL